MGLKMCKPLLSEANKMREPRAEQRGLRSISTG